MQNFPQVIPYQGSKRKAAQVILEHFPKQCDRVIEPFVGSGAITVAAAANNLANRFLVADILKPLVGIWEMIVEAPCELADAYEQIWNEQIGQEKQFFNRIRDQFNQDDDPVKLLYLICRCVKNSVRFNGEGKFNQSPDNRRKGMNPETMRSRISAISGLLEGKTEALCADYSEVLAEATPNDVVYMDPPYQGTSGKKDPRYAGPVQQEDLCSAMEDMNRRNIRFLLSYDGTCGDKVYGKELPKELNLYHVPVAMGRSSQATLLGRDDQTIESLYLSPALVKVLGIDSAKSRNRSEVSQRSLGLD